MVDEVTVSLPWEQRFPSCMAFSINKVIRVPVNRVVICASGRKRTNYSTDKVKPHKRLPKINAKNHAREKPQLTGSENYYG